MKRNNTITILVISIIILAVAATTMGIFSTDGTGPYKFNTIRGKTIMVYGKGLYKHMSAEVAPQGIAQDYITLFAGVPLLIIALFIARKGSVKGMYLLAGTLGYFLVTYLFYTAMGMYNKMFLVYIALMGTSFYAFILTILHFNLNELKNIFKQHTPVKTVGGFLIFTSICIALLWLGIIVPPLLDGTIIPGQVEHYTTLIVQGLDLGILLPAAFISGILLVRKKPSGYLFGPVYFVFLSLLMMALTAKVIAMKVLGYNVIPVIFIIPTFSILTLICAFILLKNIEVKNDRPQFRSESA
ncbi:MAG TPA: hypothetical protein VD993_03740 [Chitinophagaceae bacterium]|nr:hypothetical protein [Chitinophagaceae bacterium]